MKFDGWKYKDEHFEYVLHKGSGIVFVIKYQLDGGAIEEVGEYHLFDLPYPEGLVKEVERYLEKYRALKTLRELGR